MCCGNPGRNHVYLKIATEASLADIRQMSSCPPKDPAKFALKLKSVFFSDQELSVSNCTKADGKKLLDPTILLGIRCKSSCCFRCCDVLILFIIVPTDHTNYKYPVPPEAEARRWQTIVVKNLNTKCHATRRKLKFNEKPTEEQESLELN